MIFFLTYDNILDILAVQQMKKIIYTFAHFLINVILSGQFKVRIMLIKLYVLLSEYSKARFRFERIYTKTFDWMIDNRRRV